MRALIIILICIPATAMAQKEGRGIAPGASLALAEEAGFNLRLHYFPNHKMCFGLETNIFPKPNEPLGEDIEFTFNGHFIFEISDHWGIYPIAGAGWKQQEVESGWRALTGGGFHGNYNQLQPYMEYIYSSGFRSEGLLIVGTFITLEFKKDNE